MPTSIFTFESSAPSFTKSYSRTRLFRMSIVLLTVHSKTGALAPPLGAKSLRLAYDEERAGNEQRDLLGY